MPGETLGRFNVCPTEPVLAVDAPSRRGARAALGPDPAVGAQAARRARADQRPLRDAARQAAVRAADRERRRTAASSSPTAGTSGCGPSTRRAGACRSATRSTAASCSRSPACGDEGRVGGERIASVTVLTTTANAVCAPVHDRMPCVLAGAEAEAAWLSPDVDADGRARPARPARGRAHRRRARQPRRQPRRRRGPRAARRPARRRSPVQLPARMSTTADDLVGREAELATIERVLDARRRAAGPASSPSWGSRGSARPA